MAGGAQDVALAMVFPILGVFVANAMFLSPLMAVLAARLRGDLREARCTFCSFPALARSPLPSSFAPPSALSPRVQMNPYPFPMIMANCAGWLAYGYNQRDYFIFFSNWPVRAARRKRCPLRRSFYARFAPPAPREH